MYLIKNKSTDAMGDLPRINLPSVLIPSTTLYNTLILEPLNAYGKFRYERYENIRVPNGAYFFTETTFFYYGIKNDPQKNALMPENYKKCSYIGVKSYIKYKLKNKS